MTFHVARVQKFNTEDSVASTDSTRASGGSSFVLTFNDGAALTLRVRDVSALMHLLCSHTDLIAQRRRLRLEALVS
eukprot:CAMPEP_0206225362 /NCGR_PEP_ID=MMETSP0047_2-20121206/7508_1 /ASSEMBLY_ACC=CAM_ASM_000192 /TAXON_ID=195065 /ORGANISM="Chroomonas mesostigmatica_cf, Strain CCMP1168" /LENGTH=75 /DNA_ID=CAMNT_0053648359 /DNA_START=3 /DNA_END=226 /DNA_ORIENTATION=-